MFNWATYKPVNTLVAFVDIEDPNAGDVGECITVGAPWLYTLLVSVPFVSSGYI